MNFVNRLAFISPFLFTFAFVTTQGQGLAAVIGAEEATKLLARSQSVEEKCKFLTPSQHEELSAFVAKAEIAMVAKSTTSNAKSIITAGRAEANNATCSDAERAEVIDIIDAAHQATTAISQANVAPTPVPKKIVLKKTIVTKVSFEKPMVEKKIEKAPSVVVNRIHQTAGLNHYAALTQRYYIARRCKTMSYGSITGLYKDVVSSHKLVVSSFGARAVRAVMNHSEANANAAHCS